MATAELDEALAIELAELLIELSLDEEGTLLLMAELLDEKLDSMLELLLVSVEDAWLDVDALSAPEPLLPPHALNSDSNSGMQSVFKGAELDLPVHDIKGSPVGYVPPY
ncbi:MAG TPA: hypothetical protein VL987_08790 [Cellvibrio sp.]|nr:hypothetical protein [Cellvibrio sp.]